MLARFNKSDAWTDQEVHMSRKAISISIICLMLAASLIITGMTVSKSKPEHAVGSSQQKVVKPDPPGTIDGAINPELIPDLISYTLVFRTIAVRQGTAFEKARSRAWAKSAGLDEAAADKLIEAASEFEARVKVLDQQAKEIKDRTWPDPGAATIAQLTALQARKAALVAEIVASLSPRLGKATAGKLRQHVTEHLKRKMKIAPVSANPIGKHH
jgi:hypothetical protein